MDYSYSDYDSSSVYSDESVNKLLISHSYLNSYILSLAFILGAYIVYNIVY